MNRMRNSSSIETASPPREIAAILAIGITRLIQKQRNLAENPPENSDSQGLELSQEAVLTVTSG